VSIVSLAARPSDGITTFGGTANVGEGESAVGVSSTPDLSTGGVRKVVVSLLVIISITWAVSGMIGIDGLPTPSVSTSSA